MVPGVLLADAITSDASPFTTLTSVLLTCLGCLVMVVINGVTRERKDKGDEGINLDFGKLSLALSFIQALQNNRSSLDLERKKLASFFPGNISRWFHDRFKQPI